MSKMNSMVIITEPVSISCLPTRSYILKNDQSDCALLQPKPIKEKVEKTKQFNLCSLSQIAIQITSQRYTQGPKCLNDIPTRKAMAKAHSVRLD